MSTERRTRGRQVWAVVGWLALAALGTTAIVLRDVSLAIGAGVVAVWALRFGFLPASAADRP
jgi:hypothetical protein